MERISKYQLGAMIILFQIGSTPLFELGIRANQDAWLVVFTSFLLGLLLLFLFLAIQHREPEKNWSQLLIQYFGSFAGKFVLLLYALFFAYESMRNLRDFGDLTLMTILPRGPISLIMLIMLTISIYAIYKGIEVFFRLAEFIVVGVLSFYLILLIMQFISGAVHWNRLFPVLENGLQPVLRESVAHTVWFPFGQMVIFLMFWSYLNEKKEMFKTSIRSFFISGIVILIANIMNLVVLGPELTGISTVPLLQSVQLIQIAEIFERFDALVILLFYAGIFIKATLWYLAAILGLSQLFHTDYRRFALPVGAVIYITSLLPRSWQSHLEIGDIIADQFHVNKIFIGIIPAVLFFVMLIRGRLKRRPK
ncbi:GerAB/ArcD/ProY family transporter [Paenibacillus sedimenti]|uniref:GerAB/ArcD/ProY family transporter n=1 Tax=Paenibacillus sedimenti TaxID=2770274 RepID=A0A926KX16_9BACL|nr:GerAB/ArcD/ProY family transporter [Paenibacillus sedimenti]MBD0383525.1 GerAB/ArcD/ProY family transporter [Paenibacillus sedimenti]